MSTEPVIENVEEESDEFEDFGSEEDVSTADEEEYEEEQEDGNLTALLLGDPDHMGQEDEEEEEYEEGVDPKLANGKKRTRESGDGNEETEAKKAKT